MDEAPAGRVRRRGRAAATIHDVAARAGVSVATVSRVLNGKEVVRAETLRQVREAAEALRYVPNVAARSLSGQRNQTLGIVLPDVHGEFFSEVIRGVDLAAAPGGTVYAAAPGRVVFAGTVAGRGVLTIEVADSGTPPLRTTYEPVTARVATGERVTAGEVVAVLQPAGSHCPAGCLHWGLLRGSVYLDPLGLLPSSMLRSGHSRLLPVFGVPPRGGGAPAALPSPAAAALAGSLAAMVRAWGWGRRERWRGARWWGRREEVGAAGEPGGALGGGGGRRG